MLKEFKDELRVAWCDKNNPASLSAMPGTRKRKVGKMNKDRQDNIMAALVAIIAVTFIIGIPILFFMLKVWLIKWIWG